MADEAKLCSSIHSTFELLVVQPMVGCCHGEESGPFCWPMPAAGIAVFGASHQFAETLRCNGFTGIQKAIVDQNDSRPPKAMTFIWLKFSFEKCIGYSSQSSHWLGHCQLSYKIHFSSHIAIPSRSGLLLHRIRKDDTSKLCVYVYMYVYLVTSWGTQLSSFFTFQICFKWQMTIEWKEITLDKNLIWAVFLFEFKMGCKAVKTTCNIKKAFDPGTANECTVQWWLKKFCKGDETWKWET